MTQTQPQSQLQAAERAFLHQIASPLTAIQLSLSRAIEDLGAMAELDPGLSRRLELAQRAAQSLADMVAERRRELIRLSEKEPGTS